MEKKELTMETRLLLAFVLVGIVLLVSQYFFKPVTTTPAAQQKSQEAASDKGKPADIKPNDIQAAKGPAPAAAAQTVAVAGQVQADQEENITVDTDVYRVLFSNRGAVVRSWVLKGYKDHSGKPLELVNQRALAKVAAPFVIALKNQQQLQADPNSALFKVERSPDGLGLSFEYSDGQASTKKTFKFNQKSYLVDVTSDVSQNGVRLPHSLAWRGGFGDASVTTAAADQHTVYYDPADTGSFWSSKLKQHQPKDAKDAPVSASGQFSFAGIEDHFFAGVFLPAAKQSMELTTYSDQIPNAAGTDEARIGAAAGGDGLNRLTFFAGPKDQDLLRKVDPKLEQLIDWGTWFGIIAKPLYSILTWTKDNITHNFGWAIVLVTVGINIVLFPLRFTSMKSAKKMQTLQPQIAAINEKYKGLALKDPKKAEQNQEMMDLYKKNGVNPVGGCLPTLLQLPFLIAFYTVLSVGIEMRGASWLWVPDLSQAETIPIHILPVLVVITQFITQRMTPSPGMDPAQQKMMMFMPLVFGYMFYFSSAGLALYWFTGGVVAIAQQLILNRLSPAPAVTAPPKKKNRN